MRVIVVGAGITGLVAARALASAGVDVTVVERAAAPGGRLSTLEVGSALVDAGAQFFTVRTPAFGARVDDWQRRGLVRVWSHGFGVDDGHPRYVATSGMRSLADDLARGIDVRCSTMAFAVRPRTIDPRTIDPGDTSSGDTGSGDTGSGESPDGWTLVTDDGRRHDTDALVLTTPLPQSYALLADTGLSLDPRLVGTDYDRTIAWLAELDRPPAIPAPGAVQQPAEDVAIVADGSAKGIGTTPAVALHAAPAWSERHWDDDRAVLAEHLRVLAGPWIADAVVVAERVVRWRFATPRRVDDDPCWVSPDRRIVLAGDAFAGPRVEGAHNSGLAAAHTLVG